MKKKQIAGCGIEDKNGLARTLEDLCYRNKTKQGHESIGLKTKSLDLDFILIHKRDMNNTDIQEIHNLKTITICLCIVYNS